MQPCRAFLNRDFLRALLVGIFNPLTFCKPAKKGCRCVSTKFKVVVEQLERFCTCRSAFCTSLTRCWAMTSLSSQCLRFFGISNFFVHTPGVRCLKKKRGHQKKNEWRRHRQQSTAEGTQAAKRPAHGANKGTRAAKKSDGPATKKHADDDHDVATKKQRRESHPRTKPAKPTRRSPRKHSSPAPAEAPAASAAVHTPVTNAAMRLFFTKSGKKKEIHLRETGSWWGELLVTQ